jgi:flagellar motor switch protein FliG
MTHNKGIKMRWALAAALLASFVGATSARAERRAPYGNDAQMLETRVREEIERRVNPLLEQTAPGQAELKYVDVRVTRPSALPSGAAPGFEELTPGTEFVAEKADVQLVFDAKLPTPFRRDLKNLIKNRLDAIAVPIEIHETVIPFPTPRPQPVTREPLPYYPQPPQPQPQPAAQTAPAPAAATPPPQPPADPAPRGLPTAMAIALAALALLIGALAVALVFALRDRRRSAAASSEGAGTGKTEGSQAAARAGAAVDRLPEVRRALREDRVLARRVMSELLRENQLDKVAIAVELVGPSVVEDLRGDPTCAVPLREAAALLVEGRSQGEKEVQEVVAQLHRRILKNRMVGAEDPVEQQFAFLLGLTAPRLAAVLAPETPAVQAATLRYAPGHLRSAYLAERTPAERTALATALAAPKALSKEHMLDVAATLRDRAAEQAHLDAGETGDVDLAVELIEERPAAEQAEILEAMRRADPGKARAVRAALISDESFLLVGEDVLVTAAVAVPTEVLTRFLREAPEEVATRLLAALPPTVSAAVREELSLEVAVAPAQAAEARRALFASLRRALRDRGLVAPGASASQSANNDKGKVVAL